MPLIAVAALLWLALAVPKVLQHASGNTADLDTGNYHHLAWAVYQGEGFSSSILGRHHLGEHFSPIMLLVGLPYLVWTSAYVILLLQATAVWGAIVLVLWQTGRELLAAKVPSEPVRAVATGAVLVMALLYPGLIATWATQFQPIELGMPLVVGAMLLIGDRRDKWLWPVVILLLMTRESAPLAVAGLGLYAGLGHGRWKLMAVLLIVAAIWFGVAMGLVMPYFRGGTWGHKKYIGWGADWEDKSLYLAAMLFGFGVLPFLGRRALAATLGAVPGLLLNVSVDRYTQYQFLAHYDAQTAPFLMLAAAHGVGWIATKAMAMPRRQGLTVAGVVCVVSVAAGAILSGETGVKGPFVHYDEWWPTPEVRAALAEGKWLANKYRDAPALTAHHRVGPHVSARPNYVAERMGRGKASWVHFASTRLQPGHILIVPAHRQPLARSGMKEQVERSGHAKLIDPGRYVNVWQWPEDAPPPGTEEAKRYAAEGYLVQ